MADSPRPCGPSRRTARTLTTVHHRSEEKAASTHACCTLPLHHTHRDINNINQSLVASREQACRPIPPRRIHTKDNPNQAKLSVVDLSAPQQQLTHTAATETDARAPPTLTRTLCHPPRADHSLPKTAQLTCSALARASIVRLMEQTHAQHSAYRDLSRSAFAAAGRLSRRAATVFLTDSALT